MWTRRQNLLGALGTTLPPRWWRAARKQAMTVPCGQFGAKAASALRTVQ